MLVKTKNNINLRHEDLWHVEDASEIVICEKGIPTQFSSKDRILRTYLEKFNKNLPSLTESEKISQLEQKLHSLEDRLKLFESEVVSNQHKIIEVRNIPIEQAQKEVEDLLSDGQTRYFDEIAETLNLDIKVVVESFKKLNAEGKLFVDERPNKI